MTTAHPVMDRIDWQKAGDETLSLLSCLLQLQTVNAPGQNPDETSAATLMCRR